MRSPEPSTTDRQQRLATIKDVAERAAVSIATVSRVMNGATTVDPALTARVQAVAAELHYTPNRAAASLAGQHVRRTIGLLVSDIQNPFAMEIIRGVEDIAQRNGYLVILGNSNEDPRKERQYVEVFSAEPVAGAIIKPTRERYFPLHLFRNRHIPVVTVDRRLADRSADAVLIDNSGAARELVAHLIANGYRRIAMITGPLDTTTGRDRLLGYRQALLDAGIDHDPALESDGPYTQASGRLRANGLLDSAPGVEAIVSANNRLTTGVLEALHDHNLRIPDDIAVAGFDEAPWVAPGTAPLTTLTQPAYEIGKTAALRLLQRLQEGGPLAVQEITLAYHLQVRDSSRPRGVLSR